MQKTFSLAQLAEQLDADLIGDGSTVVNAVATLQKAEEGQITFLSNSKYRKYLAKTNASAIILSKDDVPFCQTNMLVHKTPYVAFAKLAQMLDDSPPIACGVHPSAVLGEDVVMGKNVSIGPHVVIERGVSLGDNVQVGANSYIGEHALIGADTTVYPNVTVHHRCVLGERCTIQSQSVLGGNGFGYANDKGSWVKIPQTGRLVIGDDVEIGASTCIDRGALDDTVIGSNVIIDNNVQIGHNTHIGYGSCVCGNVGIAGSANIGKHVVIGGGCVINGHITVVDGVQVTGFSMVTKDLLEVGVYSSGQPALSNKEWRRNTVRLRQIDTLYSRVKELEDKVLTDD